MSKLEDILNRLAAIQEPLEVVKLEVAELAQSRELLSPYGQALLEALEKDSHDSLVSVRYLRKVVIENGVPPRPDND
jgi:hypothetical protein